MSPAYRVFNYLGFDPPTAAFHRDGSSKGAATDGEQLD